ncbi:LysR family transcriptional regulator [Propionispora vibrioides]|uniref:DNA-binding transcriptional regulator, LysR family n=1 Tax=Propionispora vibrioides TaxID=112903 RepID=A0A1H8XCZ9_9FIRM|nr:LysR family transcriptional regulator [Propionispora vibrioides]SEP37671.1 DNA-binding transcriptional regulator, LysR family [Propionispora vibrioides]
MDLHQLKYFQTLANKRNFTKAADDLALSQSALSRSIARMEEELGIPLFERKSRGVVLNRYGEVFLRHVDIALKELLDAQKEIHNMIDPSHGTILIAFIQPLGSSFVPDLISAFQKQAPGIKFQLNQDTTKRILSQLESTTIDIGFCTQQEPMETLSSIPIMKQELFLIVHKDHRLATKEQVDLCEVANDPFVLYKPETALHDIVVDFCRDAGFHPKISFEAFEERTIAGLVGAKYGVALIPFIPGLDMQKISIIRVRIPHCLTVIQMVWRTNSYMSPAATHFKAYVENTILTP